MPLYSNLTFWGGEVNKTSSKDKYVIIPFSVFSCHTFFFFGGGITLWHVFEIDYPAPRFGYILV
jgi:hypothetical protein